MKIRRFWNFLKSSKYHFLIYWWKNFFSFYWLFRYKTPMFVLLFWWLKGAKVNSNRPQVKIKGFLDWPSYLDEHRKFWFPAVKNALRALDSICAPTERHILIAHAITNKDFGAYFLASCSPWKMAQHSMKLNQRDF